MKNIFCLSNQERGRVPRLGVAHVDLAVMPAVGGFQRVDAAERGRISQRASDVVAKTQDRTPTPDESGLAAGRTAALPLRIMRVS